jgi:ubiquinone biosynthesis protein COQ9
VLALLRALPAEPPIALLLALATRRSMRWMLQAAGVLPTSGVRGELRVKGLVAVWLWTIRAWRSDESQDLSATMSALDVALRRAESAAEWLGWRPRLAEPTPDTSATEEPTPDAPA